MFPDTEDSLTDIEFLNRIYYAAREGLAITVFALFSEKPTDVSKDLINRAISQEDGQRQTPLIVAARYGHVALVKMLIDKFDVNLESEGIIKDGYNITDGVTALWCAAAFGHLNVVKCLIRHGANVNHRTRSTNSTPLRAACYEGRLDIVEYLVNHGADIHMTNVHNNSCLMVAAFKGYYEIARILLAKGADPNQEGCNRIDEKKSTALHYAAKFGHISIVQLLLNYGAMYAKDENGMTPLIAAAERTRTDVVEFLIATNSFTKEEIINAYELLGASYANDRDYYCLTKAYKYLQKAMTLRFGDPGHIIKKKLCEPLAVYQNIKECENLEQLERIKNNPNALQMESLIIRERILGRHNTEVPHAIIYRGAIYADNARFDRCLELWIHALKLKQMTNIFIRKELLRFAQVFSQMISHGINLQLAQVTETLEICHTELTRSKEKLKTFRCKEDADEFLDTLELNITATLYILTILTKVLTLNEKDLSQVDIKKAHYLVYRLCSLKMTLRDGQTLLHMAVNWETPVDDFYTNDVCKFPCAITATLLIKCGADVNAMDNERNTPLHVIVSHYRPISDFMTLHSIILNLVNAGAHIDVVNSENLTPYDYAKTGVAEMILRTQTKISLKCIAAKAVKTYNLSYAGNVPRSLEHFIELHGCGPNQR